MIHTRTHPARLPDWIRGLIASPPRAGTGFHHWLFRVASALHRHWPDDEIRGLLRNAAGTCGRFVSDREIDDAIRNSLSPPQSRTSSANRTPARKPWPGRNETLISQVLAPLDGFGRYDLWEASPIRLDHAAPDAEQFIDVLFPGDPLLCCGWSQSRFDTMPRSQWRGKLAAMQFIVPSPMTSLTGHTKDGRISAHTLENTGPRRFLIAEFDTGTTDQHAALLFYLAQYAHLVLAVFSGGKSLHGWFFAHGQPENKVRQFFRLAVSLGADRATWTPSQFVRLPEGRRENGSRQSCLFFNPKPLKP